MKLCLYSLSRLAEARCEERLERIEQAGESVAVEVERVSGGQRYVAKLLRERQFAAPDSTRPLP